MIEPTYVIVQSASVPAGPAGTIEYSVSFLTKGGMVTTPENVRSHSAVDDGSGIDRKAAPVGSAWPAAIVGGRLQAYIVELEASETCDDGGTPA